jgi:hypothetical protein
MQTFLNNLETNENSGDKENLLIKEKIKSVLEFVRPRAQQDSFCSCVVPRSLFPPLPVVDNPLQPEFTYFYFSVPISTSLIDSKLINPDSNVITWSRNASDTPHHIMKIATSTLPPLLSSVSSGTSAGFFFFYVKKIFFKV